MLSDILIMIMVAYLMFLPVIVMKSIEFGARLSNKPEDAAEVPVLNIFSTKKKAEQTAEQKKATAALEETMAILENIDAYDGTGTGQKEIKHGSK